MLAQLRGQPVQLCGIDPTGILFNAIGPAGLGGDSLRCLTLRDPGNARDVVLALVAEMDNRIGQLLAEGRDRFTVFDGTLPLLIVVLEEYPGILAALSALDAASGAKASDRIETQIRAAVQRLALEGAKVGLRLWLVAQRADASLLTGVLRGQLTQRLTFSTDDDGLRMLHEGITADQVQKSATFLAGQAWAEFHGVMPLTMFRADFLDYSGLTKAFGRSKPG